MVQHKGAVWFAAGVVLLSVGMVRTASAQNAPDKASSTPTVTDSAYFGLYHSQARDTVSQAAYEGFKQFELNCARCHGDFGVGSSFAPSLLESLKPGSTIPTNEIFVVTVCGGRPDKGMPAWCALGLEMDKIQAIYAYLSGRATGKIGPGRPAVRRVAESSSKIEPRGRAGGPS